MAGYDPYFLGPDFQVPLPTFSDDLVRDVLTAAEIPTTEFQDGYYTRYIHYSVATNTRRRQPIIVALNIDQALLKPVERCGWTVDKQVGDYQLDNRYYQLNEYDRGHLARRSSSAWGETEEEAAEASRATMVYSNATLQHASFNQDEWLHLESWVQRLELDATDHVSVFSGPIYTTRRGITKFIGDPPAQIPTAFFKVVCFVSKSGALSTRAFIVAQDRQAISDKNARTRKLNLGAYQVPVSVIEEETGIIFDDVVKEGNPLGYVGDPEDEFGEIPEIIAVTSETTMTTPGEKNGETAYPGVFILSKLQFLPFPMMHREF